MGAGGNLGGEDEFRLTSLHWETSGDGCCTSAHHLPVAMETDSQSNTEGNAGFRVCCVHMLLHANKIMTGHVCDTACVYLLANYIYTRVRGEVRAQKKKSAR